MEHITSNNSINSHTSKDRRTFYHYTNMQALLNIIKPQHLVLWATNYKYLNDRDEIKRGINLIRDHSFIDEDKFKNLFILSLSQTVDDLSMWQSYSDGYNGCILGFNSNILKNRNYTVCNYDIVDVKKQFLQNKEFIDKHINQNLNKSSAFEISKKSLEEFNQYVVCLSLKDPSFKYENEWRIVWMVDKDETKLIKYRNKKGLIAPYIEYCFPKYVLSEIWIPNNEKTDMNKNSLLNMLKQYGYHDVEIIVSKTPYRNI